LATTISTMGFPSSAVVKDGLPPNRRMHTMGTESQDSESRALLSFLNAQRAIVLAIVDGLDEGELRAHAVAVRHLHRQPLAVR